MNTQDIDWEKLDLPWIASLFARNQQHSDVELVPDLLATIFEGQRILMEKYHDIEKANGCVVVEPQMYGELDDRKVQMRIKDLMERVIEELMEAANCLKNKPWKNTFVATDKAHFEEEMADALHFFVELMEVIGWDADKAFKAYFLKHAVNQFRQRSNY